MSRLNQLVRRVTAGWSSNSAPKLTPLLLFLIFFFLPTQLGRHFWPDWALAAGLRSDYLAPTVYFTDILIIFLFLYLALRWVLTDRRLPHLSLPQRTYLILWLGLVTISAGSIYQAINQPAAWWHLVKLIEFGLMGLVVSAQLAKESSRRLIFAGFLGGALVQAGIAFGQFLLGRDLGLWILGERTFNSETPGIAQAIVEGKLLLRSYGTLPHPNVLGLWMLLSSQVSLFLLIKERLPHRRLLFSLLTILFSLALLTSLSRLGLILWLVATPITLLIYSKMTARLNRKGLNLPLLAATTLTILFLLSPLTSWFTNLVEADSQTVTLRVELAKQALSLWQSAPLSGIGLANFIPRLAEIPTTDYVRQLQPAHNLYLLVAAEVGIIGLVFVATLLGLGIYRAYRHGLWWLVIIASTLVVVGLFDHYFWTLQQGGLIFWSILGGLFSPMGAPEATPVRRRAGRSS